MQIKFRISATSPWVTVPVLKGDKGDKGDGICGVYATPELLPPDAQEGEIAFVPGAARAYDPEDFSGITTNFTLGTAHFWEEVDKNNDIIGDPPIDFVLISPIGDVAVSSGLGTFYSATVTPRITFVLGGYNSIYMHSSESIASGLHFNDVEIEGTIYKGWQTIAFISDTSAPFSIIGVASAPAHPPVVGKFSRVSQMLVDAKEYIGYFFSQSPTHTHDRFFVRYNGEWIGGELIV